ncbi:uncharacterized protein LOC141630717 [Silene latifolia]|uniref:uncharacterized protein LOC141630717 n=1 Tax=Silene latifolia TaxID=37657 RepID=UPI003D78753A
MGVMRLEEDESMRDVYDTERGFKICGLTYSAVKRHVAETKGDKLESSCRISRSDLPVVAFDETDIQDEGEQHHDALIITLSIGNCLVRKILVDTGSSVNFIMLRTLKNMGFSKKELLRKAVPVVGFSGETKHSLGEIIILTFAGGVNKQGAQEYLETKKRLETATRMLSNPQQAHQHSNYRDCASRGITLSPHRQNLTKYIHMDAENPEQTVLIGADCTCSIRQQLLDFLRTNMDCFAESHDDMVGIDPGVITHRMNVDTSYEPVQQKRRKFAPKRNKVINQ